MGCKRRILHSIRIRHRRVCHVEDMIELHRHQDAVYPIVETLYRRGGNQCLSDRMMPLPPGSPLDLSTCSCAMPWRSASRSGEWKPGSAIPNESDLAREFGVSAGTMRKALDLMEGEHLLTRRQGRGTFVNDQSLRRAGGALQQHPQPGRQARLRRVKSAARSPRARPTTTERERLRLQPARARLPHPAGVRHDTATDLPWSRRRRCRPRCSRGWTTRRPRPPDRSCWPRSTASCSARPRSASRWARRPPDGGRQRSGVAAGSPVIVLDRVVHGARRPADRMAHRLLPSRRQVLHGGDGLSGPSSIGRLAGPPPTGPLQSAPGWSSMARHEVSTCPFPKLPPRLRDSPSST